MIDVETRTEILQLVREAIERAAADNESSRLAVLLDEIQQQLSASEYSYGMDGGEGSAPGNFEPTFAPDANDNNTVKLDDVGDGFWPFGRYFYSAIESVDNSAKIATGLIWLEITHPNPSTVTSGTPTPTAKVCGALNGSLSSLPSPTDTKSFIPLYELNGGRISVDFRSCMSLTMREL